MNTKKLAVLAIILVAAIAIIVLVKTLGNRQPPEETLSYYPGISAKTISAILVKDAQGTVKLQRKGDAWVMVPGKALSQTPQASGLSSAMGKEAPAEQVPAGMAAAEFPADSSTMAQLLDNVIKLKKNTLISENQSKQATFEVDSTRGTSLEVFDIAGKSLGTVILGKNGADYNSVYGRASGSNAVYLMLDISKYAFATDKNRWTDKSIMKFDKNTVKQVSLAKKGAPAIEIVRGDSVTRGWHMTQPVKKPADSTKVDEILSSLSNFMAAEYEDSAYTDSATGLAAPSISVAVTFVNGTTRTLAIGNQKQGQTKFWVKVPEKNYVYLINDSDQKKFDKKPAELEGVPLKPIEAVPAPIPAKYRKPAAVK